MAAHWLAELDGSSLAVEVPASSANLGAGYDCLGVALAMVNRIELEVRVWSRGAIELTVDGEGRNELSEDRQNCFVRGLESALRKARGELPEGLGWRIGMRNEIPLARGLGSSAAATVAGVLAGNALAGEPLSMTELLGLATEIEGHPDNAAAALLGGFVVSAASPDGVDAIRFDAPRDLRAVLFIPDLRLGTGAMRAALPASVPLADAVANLGRGRGRRGRAGHRPPRPAPPADRRPAPRAVPGGRLPAAPRHGRGGPLRPARSAPACPGPAPPILAFADSAAGSTRIEAALTAAAADGRPARPGRRRGAAQRRRPGRRAELIRRQRGRAVRSRTNPSDLVPGRGARLGVVRRLPVEEAVRRARVGDQPVVHARRRTAPPRTRSIESAGMLGSAPPKSPRTRPRIRSATSAGAGEPV